MTPDEATVLISKIQYKPRTHILFQRFPSMAGHEIKLVMYVPNSDNMDEVIPVLSNSYLAEETLKSWRPADLLHWIKSLIIRQELHEVDEFLRYDGKRVEEPHADGQ